MKRDNLIGLATFFIPFLVYLRTLCPSVYVGDSGELITAAYIAGIAHPPGYPLYVILGKLFTFLPFGSIAFRVNFMSAFFGALTTVLLYFIVLSLTERWLISLTASLSFAFSPVFWAQSVVAEVFTPNTFFMALLILIAIKWQKEHRPFSYAYLAAFLYGLGLCNHQTLVFALPAFVYLFRENIRNKKAINQVLFLLLGLSVYFYLYVRSLANPPANWDSPNTLVRFIRVITRAGYGTFRLSETGSVPLLSGAPGRIWVFVRGMKEEFTVFGLVTGMVGMVWSLLKKERTGKFLFATFFFTGIVFVAIANMPPDAHGREVVKRFYLLPGLVFAVWIGLGMAWFARRIKIPSVSALFVILPLLLLRQNYFFNDRSKNLLVRDFGMDMLNTADKDAVLFVDRWDETVFILSYLYMAEKQRQDMTIYDCHASVFPNIYGEDYIYLRGKGRDVRRKEVERPIIMKSLSMSMNRPVYYATMDGKEKMGFPLIPEGMLYRIKTGRGGGEIEKDYDKIYDTENIFNNKIYKDFRTRNIIQSYPYFLAGYYLYYGNREKAKEWLENFERTGCDDKEIYYNTGTLFLMKGYKKEAVYAYEKALELDPDYGEVHCNLGVIYENEGDFEKAIAEYEKAIRSKPDYVDAHYNMAVAYWKEGEWKEVVAHLEKVLSIDPGHEKAKKYLKIAEKNMREN